MNLFWGENYLVTIHRRPSAVLTVLEEARRRWEQHEGRQPHGIACLACTLFEGLVDGYFVVEGRVRERIEAIEEKIFKGSEGAAADLFRLRKELLRVPRLLAPTSHVLAELDTYRDLLGAALDVQVFYSFNRLGHIMKRLTAVTVIIMVPNFVASIFGMNFAHIPAGNWQLGFVVVSAFLLCMVAWGFIHSRFMGWL